MDIGTWLFMAGVVATVFVKKFNSHPPYPLKDPRLGEAIGVYHLEPGPLSGEVKGGH
jgi:hypothetical protein